MHETTLTPESVIRPAKDNTGMVYIKVRKIPDDGTIGDFRIFMDAPNAFAFHVQSWRKSKAAPYCDSHDERTISAQRVEYAVEQDDFLRLAAEHHDIVVFNGGEWTCFHRSDDYQHHAPHYKTLRAAFWACRQREAAMAKTRYGRLLTIRGNMTCAPTIPAPTDAPSADTLAIASTSTPPTTSVQSRASDRSRLSSDADTPVAKRFVLGLGRQLASIHPSGFALAVSSVTVGEMVVMYRE